MVAAIEKISRALAAVALLATATLSAQPSNEATLLLAQRIRKEIVTLPNYGVFDNITFGIGGSKVYVREQAFRPTLKKSVERVVAKIEGVDEVVNEIAVLPNSRFDEDIRAAVYANIYGHSSLSRYNPNRGVPLLGGRRRLRFGISTDPPLGAHPIHIIVNKGNVVLEGAVDSEGDKTIAGIQANQVSGRSPLPTTLKSRGQEKKRSSSI